MDLCVCDNGELSKPGNTSHCDYSEIRLKCTSDKRIFKIGRLKDCDICLPHPAVSAHHADFEFLRAAGFGASVKLFDRRSENGTYVDGHKVPMTIVYPQSVIQISIYRLQVESYDEGIIVRIFQSADQYTIEVQNASYAAGKVKILQNVSLVIRQGEFVGVIGPSGSGKTTLLKVIVGYKRPSEGCVLVGGLSLHDHFDLLKSYLGYVPQDDIIYPSLAVNQSLTYSARLRLPSDTTPDQREDLIAKTLTVLDLAPLQNYRIEHLSGGQRKRVSIGVEMLTHPRIFLMDEPDTGLDPHIQDRLMIAFRNLASSGSTIIMTTHTMEHFFCFDQLAILSMGNLVYFGPPKGAVHFFGNRKGDISAPSQIFTELDGHEGDGIQNRRKLAEKISEKYKNSTYYLDLVADRQLSDKSMPQEGKQSFWEDIISVALTPWRVMRHLDIRHVATLVDRHINLRLGRIRDIGLHIAIPIIILLVFATHNVRTTDEIEKIAHSQRIICERIEQGRLPPNRGYLTFDQNRMLLTARVPHLIPLTLVLTAIFCGTFIACSEVSQERPIYEREHLVSVEITSYLVGKLPLLFGITFIQMSLLVVGTAIMKNLRGLPVMDGVITLTLSAWASVALGLFLSSLDSSGRNSILMSIIVIVPQIIFSGAIAPEFYQNMSGISKWISSICISRWGFEGMVKVFNDSSLVEWGPKLVEYQIGFPLRESILGSVLFSIYAFLIVFCFALLLLTAINLKLQDKLK